MHLVPCGACPGRADMPTRITTQTLTLSRSSATWRSCILDQIRNVHPAWQKPTWFRSANRTVLIHSTCFPARASHQLPGLLANRICLFTKQENSYLASCSCRGAAPNHGILATCRVAEASPRSSFAVGGVGAGSCSLLRERVTADNLIW